MTLRELADALCKCHETRLDLAVIQRLTREVTSLILEVHRAGYVHRDLKPDNILVSEGGRLVLADWATSGPVGEILPHPCGTPGFKAPETETDRDMKSDPSHDMWSLGAIAVWLGGEVRILFFHDYRRDLPDPIESFSRGEINKANIGRYGEEGIS
jgi:serine/threonine protein kinase